MSEGFTLANVDAEAQRVPISRLRHLFAAICVDKALYVRAARLLGDKEFGQAYAMLEFVFDSVKEYYAEYNKLPPLGVLRSKMASDLLEQGLEAEDVDEVNEVFSLATTLDAAEEREELIRAANGYLDAFVEYQLRLELMETVASADLTQLLSQAQVRLKASRATDEDIFADSFGDMLDQRSPGQFIPTGNLIVDAYTGGFGPVTGDVIGHAAPRGGGKSTFVAQIACDVAKRERIAADNENRAPRWVYIFNYEQVEDPLTHLLTYYAMIPRDTVEQFIYTQSVDQFSAEYNYKDYELQRYRTIIQAAEQKKCPFPLTEYERFIQARKELNRNVHVVDFTGTRAELSNMAKGFVPGIVEYIDAHQHRVGNPGFLAVFIDYAGTCARMHMRTLSRIGDDVERRLVEDLPMQAKSMIAGPNKAFVWVAQQLAADEAGKKGGTRPDPNKFKGCKAFAENCNFAYVNGVTTLDDQLAIFVQSKARRGKLQPDMIGRLVGKFSYWEPVTEGLVIENDQIMDANESVRYAFGRVTTINPEG